MANNVEYSVKGDKLTIIVDISKKSIDKAPASASGKTKLVASTGGFTGIGEFSGKVLSLAVNVSSKDPK